MRYVLFEVSPERLLLFSRALNETGSDAKHANALTQLETALTATGSGPAARQGAETP